MMRYLAVAVAVGTASSVAAAAAQFPCCESALDAPGSVRFGSLAYACREPDSVLSYRFDPLLVCECSVKNTNCSSPAPSPAAGAGLFQCSNDKNNKLLSLTQVNDNFCDCGDDEPNTSACGDGGQFWCAASQTVLPSSRVGDGVKDCCDCSDESSSTTQCANSCHEEEERRQRVLEARMTIVRDGLVEAQALLEGADASVRAMHVEVAELQEKKSTLQAQQQRADAAVQEFANLFTGAKEEDGEGEQASPLWRQVAKEFDQKQRRHPPRRHADRPEGDEQPPPPPEPPAEPERPPLEIFKRLVQQRRHREFFEKFKSAAASSSVAEVCESEAASKLLDELDAGGAATSSSSSVHDVDRRLTHLNALLLHDFGPNHTLVSLVQHDDQTSFTKKSGEHTFTFKAFDSCTQGPAGTSLGKYVKWRALGGSDNDKDDEIPQEINEGESTPKPTLVMEFDKGQACYQGTIRSTRVYLRCGAGGHELLQVFEPEMCRYVFLVKSPVACLVGSEAFPLDGMMGGGGGSLWRRAKSWLWGAK